MKQQQLGSKILKTLKKLGIAAPVIGAAILFFACENNDLEKIKAFSSTENLPTLEAENFESTYTDSGEVRSLLKAPKLLRFENEGKTYTEFPNGIELVEFDANKKIISSITADYARQYIKEEKWEAKNNVVAVNAQGDTLKTELLIWDEGKDRIYSDQFVKIIQPDMVMTGVGFESNQSMSDWKILKPTGYRDIDVDVEKDNKLPTDSLNKPNERVKEPEVKPLNLH